MIDAIEFQESRGALLETGIPLMPGSCSPDEAAAICLRSRVSENPASGDAACQPATAEPVQAAHPHGVLSQPLAECASPIRGPEK